MFMNDILNCLEKFVYTNRDKFKNQEEWGVSFTHIFSNNYTEEEISKVLIANASKNIDMGDGTSIAIVYMQPWKEIHLIRVSNTTTTIKK